LIEGDEVDLLGGEADLGQRVRHRSERREEDLAREELAEAIDLLAEVWGLDRSARVARVDQDVDQAPALLDLHQLHGVSQDDVGGR
jgi:hypothetical protein